MITIVDIFFTLMAIIAWILARERENQYKERIAEVCLLISKLSQESHRLKVRSREQEELKGGTVIG
jgi:hypothetical protein